MWSDSEFTLLEVIKKKAKENTCFYEREVDSSKEDFHTKSDF